MRVSFWKSTICIQNFYSGVKILCVYAVHSLCSLDLVCKRFSANALPHLSITNYAAKEIFYEVGFKKKRGTIKPASWKHLLLLSDPIFASLVKIFVALILVERQVMYKNVLYQIAFQRGENFVYEKPESERKAAEADILKRFGKIESVFQNKNLEMGFYSSCFTGEGLVLMADGSLKSHFLTRMKCLNSCRRVCNLVVGDVVQTEAFAEGRTIVKIDTSAVFGPKAMGKVGNVWLTSGHPVFVNGCWRHPFEVLIVASCINQVDY